MQRKPGFPVANCSIKMPDNMSPLAPEAHHGDEDVEQQQRRQQLINFGHSQWGFNNWSWTVTKQELDFVDFTNGKYCAGVVAFVSVTVKSFDIHRENIGYATTLAPNKGFAIYKSRKCAVTNALRETLLSFGGSVATDLMELVEHKAEAPAPAPAPAGIPEPLPVPPPAPMPVQIPVPVPEPAIENNQNILNRPVEPKNAPLNMPLPLRKEDPANMRHPLKNATNPPVAKAHPMPCALPPRLPAPQPRPNSNEVKGDDEEARAERKRRQRQAQEEFRLRQVQKQQGLDEKQELNKNASSFDKLLMELPSQDIVIEQTGDSVDAKRKSPGDGGAAKRRASVRSRLDIRPAD